jgi:hypothetical protein
LIWNAPRARRKRLVDSRIIGILVLNHRLANVQGWQILGRPKIRPWSGFGLNVRLALIREITGGGRRCIVLRVRASDIGFGSHSGRRFVLLQLDFAFRRWRL